MDEKVNQSAEIKNKKSSHDKKSRSGTVGLKTGLIVLSASFLFAVMVLGYYFGYSVFAEQGGNGTGIEVEVVVEEGDTLSQVAGELYDAGLIEDRLVFMFQAHFYEYRITPGLYTLNDAMTYEEIFIQLEGGGL